LNQTLQIDFAEVTHFLIVQRRGGDLAIEQSLNFIISQAFSAQGYFQNGKIGGVGLGSFYSVPLSVANGFQTGQRQVGDQRPVIGGKLKKAGACAAIKKIDA
jgi:hypothetical protein